MSRGVFPGATGENTLWVDMDEEDVRLLILWAWRYAKTRDTFAPRHVKRLAERHKHLLNEWDLKEILEGGDSSSE